MSGNQIEDLDESGVDVLDVETDVEGLDVEGAATSREEEEEDDLLEDLPPPGTSLKLFLKWHPCHFPVMA